MNMKSIFLTLICCFLGLMSMAQPAASVEMADSLRTSGMIWVVIAVMAVIFAGLLGYLFMLDGRLRKIEKSQSHKN